MIAFAIFWFFMVFILGLGIAAAWSDVRTMTIDNSYSLIIFALFPVCYLVMFLLGDLSYFQPILSHVIAFLLVFGVSAAMFSFGLMGAADSKLASAFALWFGLKGSIAFLIYMTLMGGVLGLCALYMAKYKPFKALPEGSWPAQVQAGASKVPYGIAISFGAFVSFWFLGYFDMEALRQTIR